MRHEERVKEAFEKNKIERVLLVDDGYDPPPLDDGALGALLDFLECENGKAACKDAGIDIEDIDAANVAAEEGNTDSENLQKVNSRLYKKFLINRDPRFDPGGRFDLAKGSMLDALKPLDALLRKCLDGNEIRHAGLEDGRDVYQFHKPHVVFLDYHMGPDSQSAGGERGKGPSGSVQSVDLLKDILDIADSEVPAIVLMSSREMGERAEEYRLAASPQGDNLLAVRFRFLLKEWLREDEKSSEIKITHDAADTLLDMAQGFIFGQELQRALGEWRKGAKNAMDTCLREISGLEQKDFAYLLRFRLAGEGETMGNYLRWMFGESLHALVNECDAFDSGNVDRLDRRDLIESIEGAFEGSTRSTARIFHRIKIDKKRRGRSRNYALGDIYISTEGSARREIRVVVTPDCDLVARNGDPNASNVLTMGGELQKLDHDCVSADQFVLYNNEPYGLKWSPKVLETFPIYGEHSLDGGGGYELFGTLRPLYAQEMQRQLLSDLSRVGLTVAPALGFDAKLTTYLQVRDDKETSFEKLEIGEDDRATILLGRAGDKNGHKFLLRRKYLFSLLDKLHKYKDYDRVRQSPSKRRLSDFIRGESKLVREFLIDGSSEKGPFGSRFVIGRETSEIQNDPWLKFLLEVPARTMEEMRAIDPTLRNAGGPEAESDE